MLVLSLCSFNLLASHKVGSITISPYLGVEYQYEHIKADSNWREILSANYNNVAIFVGAKYHKNFGFEIGYYHWIKVAQEQDQVTAFNNQAVNGNGVAPTKARMAFKGFSIDWDIYYPLDPNFNVYLILGLATMHPHFEFTSPASNNFGTAFNKITGNNRTVPRLGGGMEYVEKNWGARARVIWDYTQKMSLNVTSAQQNFAALYGRAFQQGILVTVGVFYIF